jgi:hypothetical protein
MVNIIPLSPKDTQRPELSAPRMNLRLQISSALIIFKPALGQREVSSYHFAETRMCSKKPMSGIPSGLQRQPRPQEILKTATASHSEHHAMSNAQISTKKMSITSLGG